MTRQFILPLADELIVDLFAGGGGMSVAIEQALGRHADIAVNHNDDALSMHRANHPQTRHFIADVFEVDPRGATQGRPVGHLHLSPDCFPAGTMILTAEGYRPIEEISIGDMVLTHRGRWRAVTATMSAERELMRIRGHGHPGLLVSPEHPLYARHREMVWSQIPPRQYRPQYSEPLWAKAADLDKGWYWATPHAFPVDEVPAVGGRGMEANRGLLWLVGRYLGDGWTRLTEERAELVIICGRHEAKGLEWMNSAWERMGARAGYNELAWHVRDAGTAIQFSTSHRGLVEWLREHFGHGAAEKRIPGWALGMATELRQSLLDGYMSADGHKTETFMEVQSVSKALALGIKALAESLGHTVAVYTASNRDMIQGRKVNVRQVWRCRWRHVVDADHAQTVRDDLHEWSPIRKVEHDIGASTVFNLSVEEDESYVVEGIVVHNCTHFSQAKGGQPRSAKIRGLSWVALRWAGQARPRCISLENVKQLVKWGPLVAKRDAATGRVIRLDGTVAGPGERVPVAEQFLIPDPKRAGKTWARFLTMLRGLGYTVEHRLMVAADYGAPTTRERLFLFARCDGEPIVWPKPTHHKNPERGQKRWRAAAECIDWTIPCPSIFERKRPLADATLRRIARGIKRYVIDAKEPFIVPATHQGSDRGRPVDAPLPTITAAHRGEQMLVSPILAGVGGRAGDSEPRSADQPQYTITAKADTAVVAASLVQAGHGEGRGANKRRSHGINDIAQPLGTVTASNGGHYVAAASLIQTGYGEREGQAPRALDIDQPLGTVVGGAAKHAAVAAFLAQQNTMPNGGVHAGHDAREPLSTVTNSGSQQNVVAASLATLRGTNTGRAVNEPLRTASAGGEHHALVQYTLSPEQEAGALRCAALLIRYYGEGGQWGDLSAPAATLTTKDRLGLVTVWLHGHPYVIVDIGLRMLTPRELYRAQGFPDSYIIERGHDGRVFTKSAQVRMVGNSVSPQPAAALLSENHAPRIEQSRAAA